MTAPLPNTTVSVLGPDGQFTLPWRRWFQQLPGGSGSGLPGPPGPAGPSGPAGPPGTSGPDILSLAALGAMDGYLPLTGGTVTGQLTVSTASAPAFIVNANGTIPTGLTFSGVLADFIGPVGNTNTVFDGIGGPHYVNCRANFGTLTTPTAPGAGYFFGGITSATYTGSAYAGGPGMFMVASEAWTPTANGAELSFWTNPKGVAAASAAVGGFTSDGSFFTGTGPAVLSAATTGGFLMVPKIASDPSGTPAVTNRAGNVLTGNAPIVFNPSNDKLWMYDGSAWQNMGQPITGRTAFTPTVTFATPGDLSVAYTTQSGFYAKVGPLVFVTYILIFTPTYTTASGNLVISQPPAAITAGTNWPWPVSLLSAATWPASTTTVVVRGVSTGILVTGLGSTGVNTAFTTTQFVSGTAYNLQFSGFYF